MYLGECPKIKDGHHFHGNEARGKKLFCFFSIFFHTDHNKCTMKWVGWKMSKKVFRPAPPLNPFVLSYVYIRTKSKNCCDSCTYIYVHGLYDRNMGLYRRLTDILRYHPTSCSRASGLWHPLVSMFTKSEEKWILLLSCPLFLASFGKLWLSDQIQFIAWHGIQRRIIWIFCRESEVSG